jgi:hypothetical protein
LGNDCGDDHGGLARPKVGGHDAGGVGRQNGEVGAGKSLVGDGGKSGRFGGSHAMEPTRLAGIVDQ